MTSFELEVDTGRVYPLPVPPTSADLTVITSDCRLVGWSLRDVTGDVAKAAEGAVLSPGVNATLVSLGGLPAGTYIVNWEVSLQGAAAAVDANNFTLDINGTQFVGSINPGVAGSYPQIPVEVTVPANAFILIASVAAGTAGVTYAAQLSLDPVDVANTVAEIQDSGNILGEISLGANGSETDVLDSLGMLCQGQIKVHVVSGRVTGVIYARLTR